MTEINSNILTNSVFCLIFAGCARLTYTLIDSETRLIELIMLTFLTSFFVYCSLITFNNLFNFKILSKILIVMYLPFGIVFFLRELFAFFLPVLLFLLIYFLPTSILRTISESNGINSFNFDGILYLINVVTVLFYAYYGDNLMRLLFIIFKVNFFKKIILNEILTKNNIRMYTYFTMILIYLTYNFYVFNGIESIWIYSIDSFNIIKEVFVTFVAIDTLIQIFKTNQNNDNNKDLKERFKARYKTFKEKINYIFQFNDYKS